MRVLAAVSQWVSSARFVSEFPANSVPLGGYLTGFTSTSDGKSVSFLLHLGQYPLYC